MFSDLSGPEVFPFVPLSSARGKKRLCHKSKACWIERYVAIPALVSQHFACKTAHRDCVRTGTKNTIMVLIIGQKDPERYQYIDGEENPDWNAPSHQEDDWQMASYAETELRL